MRRLDPQHEPMTFGALLKQHRREANLSQEELASRAGYTFTYISMLERGKRPANRVNVTALARALELSDDDSNRLFAAAKLPLGVRLRAQAILLGEDMLGAPDIRKLVGREEELSELERWIVGERCRVVAVLGIGGIGKSALAATLLARIKDQFHFVIWLSLLDALPIADTLGKCVACFSQQLASALPEDLDGQLELLLTYLRGHRCLLVLDNMEPILQSGSPFGGYRDEHRGYARLIQLFADTAHQSCLLLTSREEPREVASRQGTATSVRSLSMAGLGVADGRTLLSGAGLSASDVAWADLIHLYSGNPQALGLIADPIRKLFGGDIGAFLSQRAPDFGGIDDVLREQINRVSDLEMEIMYWLAIARETASLEDLRGGIMYYTSPRDVLEALSSLRRRHLIERMGTARFTLQPVVMEFVTNRLIDQVCDEISSLALDTFAKYALIMARAKDYVRQSQERVILEPIAARLSSRLGYTGLDARLKDVLAAIRERHAHSNNYAAGNLLNLMRYLNGYVRGIDVSGLAVRQAFLQGAVLTDVNMARCEVQDSLFTETFRGVLSVAVSPSGNVLAAGTMGGEIRMWHLPDNTPLKILQGHTGWVRSVAFSPDGMLLASGGDDATVRLWNVSTGQPCTLLSGHADRVWSVAFTPDGQHLVSAGEDNMVGMWDVEGGPPKKVWHTNTNRAWPLALSPDGRLLACLDEHDAVCLWDVTSGELATTLVGDARAIRSITFSPDGRMLASGGDDSTITLWEVSSGNQLNTLHGHVDAIWSVAFSPDNQTLASGGDDGSVKLWDVASGNVVRTLRGHINRVRVAFGRDGSILFSGSEDQTLRLWEVGSGQLITTLLGHANRIWSVAFSPDGQILGTGGEDRAVRLWEVNSACLRGTLDGHENRVRSVGFAQEGRLVVSAGDDRTIRLWEASSRKLVRTLHGHGRLIWSVAISRDGQMLASASLDDTVRLWKLSDSRPLSAPLGDTTMIRAVGFSPDGRLLAGGFDDGVLRVWAVSDGHVIAERAGRAGRVWSVSFSPDGGLLASGGDDQIIHLWSTHNWDTHTWNEIATLRGHFGRVGTVAFDPTGETLASGGEDQTVRVWDVKSGEPVHTFEGHSAWVASVAFSPDGRLLASGSEDGTTVIWELGTATRLRTLRTDRPYERMNITGIRGLSGTQIEGLKVLGAIEDQA